MDKVNEVVRTAVLGARLNTNTHQIQEAIEDRSLCERMELDGEWRLSESLQCLGELISSWPNRFNPTVLTSNFDPLIEVSMRKWHREPVTLDCHQDNSIEPTIAPNCVRVVHFHGFWSSPVTLHLEEQLAAHRPMLAASFVRILRTTTIVVIGYSGWNDLFTRTLIDEFGKQLSEAEVLWCTRSNQPRELLEHDVLNEILRKQGAVPRVAFYRVADANTFLPSLRSAMHLAHPRELNVVRVPRLVYDITQLDSARPNSLESFFSLDRSSGCGVLLGDSTAFSPEEIAASLQRIEFDIRGAGVDLALPARNWQVVTLKQLASLRIATAREEPAGCVVVTAFEELLDSKRALTRLAPEFASGQLSVLLFVRTPLGGDIAAIARSTRQELGAVIPYLRLFSIPQSSGEGALLWPGADPMLLTYDDRFIGKYATSKLERPDEALLSSSMLSAWRYVKSDQEPLELLRTRDPKAFDFVLRLGVDADDLLCDWLKSDDKKKEVWRLAQRVTPSARFLRELLRRPAEERAIVGLISSKEWNSLSRVQRETALEVRDGKPVRLPEGGVGGWTES